MATTEATKLEKIIAFLDTKKQSIGSKRVFIPEKKLYDENEKNIFLPIFSQLCSLYHYRITQSNDFTLTVSKEFKDKLRFLYSYIIGKKGAKGLYLFGGYGTGKSMTVWTLAEMIKLFNPQFEYSMLTASQIIDIYRRTAEQKDDVNFNKFKYKDLLIIDDLGSEYSDVVNHFGNKVKPIEDLLEFRYKSGLWTWTTSNYSLNQLSEKYRGYIIDRLKQMMYFIHFSWQSYRK